MGVGRRGLRPEINQLGLGLRVEPGVCKERSRSGFRISSSGSGRRFPSSTVPATRSPDALFPRPESRIVLGLGSWVVSLASETASICTKQGVIQPIGAYVPRTTT